MLERLEDYFQRRHRPQDMAHRRLWLSQRISGTIAREIGVATRVIIRSNSLSIYCSSQAAATKLKSEERRVVTILTETDQHLAKFRLVIKVEPAGLGGYGPTDSPSPGTR